MPQTHTFYKASCNWTWAHILSRAWKRIHKECHNREEPLTLHYTPGKTYSITFLTDNKIRFRPCPLTIFLFSFFLIHYGRLLRNRPTLKRCNSTIWIANHVTNEKLTSWVLQSPWPMNSEMCCNYLVSHISACEPVAMLPAFQKKAVIFQKGWDCWMYFCTEKKLNIGKHCPQS